MDERILEKLYKTFKLSERKGTGGMTFKYVPNEDVINRMNQVFKGNWCTRIMGKDVVDDQVVVEVQVDVYNEGQCYTQTGFGSQQIMRYTQGPNSGKIIDIGNAYKGALAKGIVNACTRWGVGLYKESNPMNEVGVQPAPSAPTSQLPPTTTQTPMPPVKEPAPVAPMMPPQNTSATPPPMAPPTTSATPPPSPYTQETTAPVAENTVHNSVPPMVPNQPMTAAINVVQEEAPAAPVAPPTPVAPESAPTMPSFPAPNAAPAPAPVADSPPPSTPELPMSQSSGGDISAVGISDVQRVALNGILTMHSANYDELAREAFDSKGLGQAVPPKENLSYQEAVVVIKYGNDKFKKNR